ncbi:MAG: energy-coupling factor transporter transmembrane protein EcfT [Oscillospiraceae bacterium]|jgi:energy-coupling factor transport system permease protein|nr:energy-coupling factor transporter transmembrane protein EcfT [Oscillospiraceae bacterium]
MLKDITIGQYFPGDSVIHRLDARFKIVFSILAAAMLFTAQNFIGLGIAAVFIIMCYAVSGIRFRMILKSLKPIVPLIIFTGVLNLFFIKGEEILLSWWIITIHTDGLRTSAFMVVRIITLITGMSLLTYTSSPIMLTDAIESLLSPLKKLRFPVHELAMMMMIALRFIPLLIEETDKIMMAQKARGANLDAKGLIKKAKALIPILIPLFISAFKRANELAMAMECRCYRGGEGRTRLKKLKASILDFLAFGLILCVFGIIIANNFAF